MNAIDRTFPNISDAAEFDWREDDAIIVREQPAIAVYLNNYGQVTLRRERSWDEEDDCFIPIAQENVLTVVRAILIAAGMEDLQLYRACGMGGQDIDWPEGPFNRREAAVMAMRPDIDWGKAIEDANAAGLIDDRRDADEPQRVSLKERRARVEATLREEPGKSNRAIASECGMSDKTVAAVRAEIGTESSDKGAEFRTGGEQLQLVAAE